MLDEDMRLLARRAEPLRFASQQVVLREGSEPTGIYLIEEGEVVVARGHVEIGVLEAGDVFGEMSLLMQQPTTASVVAKRPTTVGFVRRDKLERLLATYPSLASRYHHSLAKVLADRLQRVSGKLAGIVPPEDLSMV